MVSPPYLNPGDKIAIVSPARKVTKEEIQPSIDTLNRWEFEVVLGHNLYNSNHQFAGTDEERIEDLQLMLDDNSIKAILCSRGGYGTARIIDMLDFTKFVKSPKWIIGFSDITALHSHIHTNLGIETLHAIMAINFSKCSANALNSLKKALSGEYISYKIPSHPLNRHGSAQGMLVGGNLSVLYSLRGTNSDINTNNKILFIEDLDEYLYHIDRMILNLSRGGLLESIKGLIIGGMTDMNDNEIPFGKKAEEIIARAVKDFDFPVCFDFPAGHLENNSTLILGRNAMLDVSVEDCNLVFMKNNV
ncbi:MAG: LD-carboxypeptidase [Bacteroidota bacterium]